MGKMDKQFVVNIDADLLLMLGIAPEKGVKHLEVKKASELTPVYVKAHQILKQQTVASS